MHAFEKAGLGIAPFRFIGMVRKVGPIDLGNGMTSGAHGQAMGTCDFCGMGIADCCTIQDANGAKFIVGTTCVEKTADKGLKREVKASILKVKRERRHANEAAKIVSIREQLKDETIRATLSNIPHPTEWCAARGDTMLDSCEWMMENAGTKGRIGVGKTIKNFCNKKDES